jgi:hypothetical protein
MKSCDYGDCFDKGENISRLSPEGFLVATGNKAYSFREAYKRFHYCDSHHDLLMKNVWNRVRQNEDKDDDHVAPTAI